MNLNYLDFEQPIAELEEKIEELRHVTSDTEVNINDEIERLKHKSQELTASIFSSLKTAQIVQLARHPMRPHAVDYLQRLFTDFDELEGERHYHAAPAIISGIGRFEGMPVAVISQEKGRTTAEKIKRNFGMPRPEGYRKALRIMQMAEKFSLPVFTFIDTPGAYPGIGAEERNQSEAIARNLQAMAALKTPIICTVIGEGGSGGALAIGVGDRILMMQYSIYSVITPEGCASILWRSAEKAAEAAEALGVTAERVQKLGLIDAIVKEPLGGAHRDYEQTCESLKKALSQALSECQVMPVKQLVKQRYQRWMSFGSSRSK